MSAYGSLSEAVVVDGDVCCCSCSGGCCSFVLGNVAAEWRGIAVFGAGVSRQAALCSPEGHVCNLLRSSVLPAGKVCAPAPGRVLTWLLALAKS